MDLELIRNLSEANHTKIVLLVLDGVGGLPMLPGGKTELETAMTPNLDALAKESVTGLHESIGPGITPGSGPGHLALFGYNPLKYQVGRGVLSALGIDFDLGPNDVAARGNFCTIDEHGIVQDRRAGRISTEKNRELCEILQKIELPGVEVFVKTVKEHRFLLVLRGEGLSGELEDTDPQEVGEKPLNAKARVTEAQKTASLVQQFIDRAGELLADHSPANMVLLRGFAKFPDWPTFPDVYKVKPAVIAAYPMYRGVARLVGMDVLDNDGTLPGEFETLKQHWDQYDFFFLHVKATDSSAEDGDFARKVHVIEEVDALIPQLRALKPDVILITGDHSTPAYMKYHSWHPIPVILWSQFCRPDLVERFGERDCLQGGLGPRIPGMDLMPLAMANARRLEKFGA